MCLGLAYKYADLSVTQPIWFSGLIFGSAFGYFLFKEIPDLWTWIGGIVVFSSVLIITYNERGKVEKKNKNTSSSPPQNKNPRNETKKILNSATPEEKKEPK